MNKHRALYVTSIIFITAFSTLLIIYSILSSSSLIYSESNENESSSSPKKATEYATLIVISDVVRDDCPPLQYCPGPEDISYIVTANGKRLQEFTGKPNGTRLTIEPGDFKIDVFPALTVGIGWEYKNSTFSGYSCKKGPNKTGVPAHGIGSIDNGQTQKCYVKNYYETYPGAKNEK